MAQQQIAATRCVTDSESIDRRLVHSAVFQIGARELPLRRSLELIDEERLRFAVHLYQSCPHAALGTLRRRTGLWLGNRDAALFRDQAQCVWKFAALHFHHEIKNVAALAAAETIKNLFDRRNGERGSLFLMERAKPAEILTG